MTKNDLRKQYRLARARLSGEEREEKSRLISERISGLKEFREASTVMIYAAMPEEADLKTLLRLSASAGKRFVYPVCTDRTRMKAMLPGGWRRGAYGIPEPDPEASEETDPGEIDLVICPGIAFDDRKTRLGMGGGYYDRFLPGCGNAAVIMAAFEAQHAACLPREAEDYPMDLIVTEERIYS